MSVHLATAIGAATLLLQAGPAAGDPFDGLRRWIRGQMERTGAPPSLAVAVARDGRTLWEEGFGWADREGGVPATPHTRYSVASVSKPVTATGLMVLVERGAVDLDRPVNDYLGAPGVRIRVGCAEVATVRRVANHTAGLPLHHHFFVEDQRSPPPMEETIRRYGQAVYPPGQRYQYSNLGYGVLDHLIARAAARPFADFMRDEVFLPLGMRRTTIGIPASERDDYAIRYGRDGRRLPYYDFDHRGASAVFSTAHDLAVFGLFHVGRPPKGTSNVLSRTAIAQMQRPTAERDDGGGYGIGWQISDRDATLRTIVHTGGMPGVSAWLTLVPSARLVVVALANASSSLPQHVTERALAALLPAAREALVTAAVDRDGAERGRQTAPRGLVGAWVGHVDGADGPIPMRLRIERHGEVHLRLADQPDTPLLGRRFDGETLRGLANGVRLPTRDAANAAHVLRLVLTRRDETLSGSLTAIASPAEPSGFALTHWTELTRSERADATGAPPPALRR